MRESVKEQQVTIKPLGNSGCELRYIRPLLASTLVLTSFPPILLTNAFPNEVQPHHWFVPVKSLNISLSSWLASLSYQEKIPHIKAASMMVSPQIKFSQISGPFVLLVTLVLWECLVAVKYYFYSSTSHLSCAPLLRFNITFFRIAVNILI